MDNLKEPYDFTKVEFDLFAAEYDSTAATVGRYIAHEKVGDSVRRYAPRGSQRVIDLGTGTGLLIPHLQSHFKNAAIIGTDFSRNMIEQAQHKKLSATFVLADLRAKDWPFEAEAYQVAASSGVLEFIPDAVNFIKNTALLLSENGVAVLTYQRPSAGHVSRGASDIYPRTRDYMESSFWGAGLDIVDHEEFLAYEYRSKPVYYGIITGQKRHCV